MFFGTDVKKVNFLRFTKNSHVPHHQVNTNGSYKGDPLSPKEEATRGKHPPRPPPFRRIFNNLSGGAITFRVTTRRRERRHDMLEPPGAIIEENVLCRSYNESLECDYTLEYFNLQN
jgi:hypothetical protein